MGLRRMERRMMLSNRVAIVTGGATGMGRSISVKFAEEGCDIAIADINMKEANETLSRVKKKGREGLAIECDITDSKKVHELVTKVIGRFGKIDILVNNAGGGGSLGGLKVPPGIANIPEEHWDKIIATNLKGAFLFCKEVVPHMKEKRYGKIINVSSLGWVHPPTVSAHYHAAKAGIVGLTHDMACELGPFNIYVNAILPGPVRTPFYDQMLKSMTDEEKDAFFAAVGKTTPLQRVGTPEDIAGVALFLASDLSTYVTGASIPVGGGLPLKPYIGTFG
jgi:NAD(P)-dependent dehydrogenase (short-subunit alcohol dehydrogenase family)